jgi:hypothetical protein
MERKLRRIAVLSTSTPRYLLGAVRVYELARLLRHQTDQALANEDSRRGLELLYAGRVE